MHLHHTKVLVAGGGPVGLAAALFLHDQKQEVILAEARPHPVAHSHALALHPTSLDLLDAVGVSEAILAHARPVRTLAVRAGMARIATASMASAGAKYRCVAVVGQDVIERVLGEALKRRGVATWWNHRLARFDQDPAGVSVQVDELEEYETGYAVARLDWAVRRSRHVAANYLIGADGHQSVVRRQLELDFGEVGAAEHFAVFEFRTTAPLADEMTIVLHDDGVGVLWPLPDNRARWSFAVDPGRHPDAFRDKEYQPAHVVQGGIYPTLEEEFFAQLLRERAPWFAADIEQIDWRAMVRFERRLVPQFGLGRVWLAGDAAHLAGPVGIQSMNVGVAEARMLADAIAHVDPRRALESLEQYNRASVEHWRYLSGLGRDMDVDASAPAAIARRKEEFVACLPASGRALATLAREFGLRLSPYAFDVHRARVPMP